MYMWKLEKWYISAGQERRCDVDNGYVDMVWGKVAVYI